LQPHVVEEVGRGQVVHHVEVLGQHPAGDPGGTLAAAHHPEQRRAQARRELGDLPALCSGAAVRGQVLRHLRGDGRVQELQRAHEVGVVVVP